MATKNLPAEPDKILYTDPDFRISVSKKQSSGIYKNFHEEIEFKYYFAGESAMMIDNQAYAIKAGDVIVVNPYEIHTNVDIGENNGWYYLIIMDLDFLMQGALPGLDLRQRLLSNGEKCVNFIRNDPEIAGLIARVCEEVSERKEDFKLMVYSLVGELVTLLFRKYRDEKKSQNNANFLGKSAEIIAPALAKIFKDYALPISVEELAELCGLSKYHFCRVFKREMRLTAVEYINSYRLSVADILLKNKELSMEEIASRCGFNDLSYFYRCYKKIRNKPLKRKDLMSESK